MGEQNGYEEHRSVGAIANARKQRASDVVEGAPGRLVEGAANVVGAGQQQRNDAAPQRQHHDGHFEVVEVIQLWL